MVLDRRTFLGRVGVSVVLALLTVFPLPPFMRTVMTSALPIPPPPPKIKIGGMLNLAKWGTTKFRPFKYIWDGEKTFMQLGYEPYDVNNLDFVWSSSNRYIPWENMYKRVTEEKECPITFASVDEHLLSAEMGPEAGMGSIRGGFYRFDPVG
jgi:hypothetical protein